MSDDKYLDLHEEEPKPSALPAAAEEAIERWFIDTFHNRGIGGPEYNRLRDAADDLKARLASALAV